MLQGFFSRQRGRNLMNFRSADLETQRLQLIDMYVGAQLMNEHMATNGLGLLPLTRFTHPFTIKGWGFPWSYDKVIFVCMLSRHLGQVSFIWGNDYLIYRRDKMLYWVLANCLSISLSLDLFPIVTILAKHSSPICRRNIKEEERSFTLSLFILLFLRLILFLFLKCIIRI